MHLLAAINNNVEEWAALHEYGKSKPRLPLSYAFGTAFLNAGHMLSAIDLCSKADKYNISPFHSLYYKREARDALKEADVAVLSGSNALRYILMQAVDPWAKKNILYLAYSIALKNPRGMKLLNEFAIKSLAGFVKAIVVMTAQQENDASEMLGNSVPIIRMRCGIDTAFYRTPSSTTDVPEKYKNLVEKLLKEPYVIMPGDELRFNDDAIQFAEKSGMRLVRISQYGYKSGTEQLKRNIVEHNLSDRLIVLEKISYPFLRFLLQHASAYAGLVDSTWQPAGWTVACEALSSGVPMVLYRGFVSRELETEYDLPQHLVQHVSIRDVNSFTEKLASLAELNQQGKLSQQAMLFASKQLDFETTAPPFVEKIERLVELGV